MFVVENLALLICTGIRVLYQRDVVALQHYTTERLAILRLHVILLGVVENEIHVLVEADDVSLDS